MPYCRFGEIDFVKLHMHMASASSVVVKSAKSSGLNASDCVLLIMSELLYIAFHLIRSLCYSIV